jgi:hypothetical protein
MAGVGDFLIPDPRVPGLSDSSCTTMRRLALLRFIQL